MNYIAKHAGGKLSNDPYIITYDDIRRMYDENLCDAAECESVTQSSYRGESFYSNDGRPGTGKLQDNRMAFFKEVLYRDTKTSGFVMSYPHGVVIQQGERGSYYRGENQIYDKSGTTLSRKLDQYSFDREKLLYRLIADMRIEEFGFFIQKFDRTKCWTENGLTLLTEPLAQHYGLETDWLDITNDFNVALFFATCFWSNADRKWYPLTKEQTEKNEKTKFGVLFHAPYWRINEEQMFKIMQTGRDEGAILPIGYQPFMRCHSQYGYGIHMQHSIPLQSNLAFEKLHFRHSEKLSKSVFNLMDGGKKIYPQEGLDEFTDVIEKISLATQFSEAAFIAALRKNRITTFSDKYRAELEKFSIGSKNIRICGDEHPFYVSRQRIRYANRKDAGFSIQKEYGIQLCCRQTYR